MSRGFAQDLQAVQSRLSVLSAHQTSEADRDRKLLIRASARRYLCCVLYSLSLRCDDSSRFLPELSAHYKRSSTKSYSFCCAFLYSEMRRGLPFLSPCCPCVCSAENIHQETNYEAFTCCCTVFCCS